MDDDENREIPDNKDKETIKEAVKQPETKAVVQQQVSRETQKETVETKSIIRKAWELGKRVAVPKIEGEDMKFYYISDFSDLKEGYRGILEPENNFYAKDTHALVIMPGVAFDRNRNRIGYGKGFYDKFMDKHPAYHTIALAFECQMLDAIDAEKLDYRPEVLITEEKLYNEHITE